MSQEPITIKIYTKKNNTGCWICFLLLLFFIFPIIFKIIPALLLVFFIIKIKNSNFIYASEMEITENEINIIYKRNNKVAEIERINKKDISSFDISIEKDLKPIYMFAEIKLNNGETINFISAEAPKPLPYNFISDLFKYKDEIPNLKYKEEDCLLINQKNRAKKEKKEKRLAILTILFFIVMSIKNITDSAIENPNFYLRLARYSYNNGHYNLSIKSAQRGIIVSMGAYYNREGKRRIYIDENNVYRELYIFLDKAYEQIKDYNDLKEFCNNVINGEYSNYCDFKYIYLLRGIAEYNLGEYYFALQDFKTHQERIKYNKGDYNQSDIDEVKKLIRDTKKKGNLYTEKQNNESQK